MYQANPTRYTSLPYNRCGKSGLQLPAVSLGLWHNFGDTAQYANMRAMCRTAFDNGITHFDLANNYGPEPGAAERNFGKILRDDLHPYRDELIISTKAGYEMWDGPYGNYGSRKYLLASLDQSLRRMGLDYVDIFYHHRMDPDTPLEETMGALATAVQSGKALYVGLSNYDGETLKKATARYLHGIPADSRVRTDGRFLNESKITPETLAKVAALNDLAANRGQTLAEMALSWLLAKPEITSVLIGASRSEQILDNIKATQNTAFTPDELAEIDRISL